MFTFFLLALVWFMGSIILSQQEFCNHIEDEDFLAKYPDPILFDCGNGQKCVCISWARCQSALRAMELARKKIRPGYDPEKEVMLQIAMDRDLYNELEIIFAEIGHTIAGATEEFLRWSVEHPDALKQWIEECRKDGTLDKCINDPVANIEWIEPENTSDGKQTD